MKKKISVNNLGIIIFSIIFFFGFGEEIKECSMKFKWKPKKPIGKQMIPIIEYRGQKIAFAADLVPTHGHVPLPYIPGYDIRPLISLKEKELFLSFCHENNVFLFFEHDAFVELCSLKKTARGIRLNEKLTVLDL